MRDRWKETEGNRQRVRDRGGESEGKRQEETGGRYRREETEEKRCAG
jgi:hypothetical protein